MGSTEEKEKVNVKTTEFLRKRLEQGGMAHFDSGDYNMTRSGAKNTGTKPVIGPSSESKTAVLSKEDIKKKADYGVSKLATGEP